VSSEEKAPSKKISDNDDDDDEEDNDSINSDNIEVSAGL
jgi:hypothetical protein